MRSGSPIDQPSANCGTSGRSASFPRGAPPSTQAAIVSTSCCVKLVSFVYARTLVSAKKGGISRASTLLFTARAQGRASS